jgi:hypothetical protein
VGQTVPHVPQLSASDIVLTQPEGHAKSPAVHEHTLLKQLWLAAQALPHAPQLRMSLVTVVHVPLQVS